MQFGTHLISLCWKKFKKSSAEIIKEVQTPANPRVKDRLHCHMPRTKELSQQLQDLGFLSF